MKSYIITINLDTLEEVDKIIESMSHKTFLEDGKTVVITEVENSIVTTSWHRTI